MFNGVHYIELVHHEKVPGYVSISLYMLHYISVLHSKLTIDIRHEGGIADAPYVAIQWNPSIVATIPM